MNQLCENNHIPIIEIMCKLSSVKAKLGAIVWLWYNSC